MITRRCTRTNAAIINAVYSNVLSMHNVRTLVGDTGVGTPVFVYPEFIQLMDDDVVSHIGLKC